jgi:hypothetical protein
MLERSKTVDYTLDVDATIIESEKEAAHWTYKKVKGYQPILGFLQQTEVGQLPEATGDTGQSSPLRGLIVADEFREGNVPAGAGAVAFLKRCKEKLPADKRLKALRSDSAFYQAEVFNWCQSEGVHFVICADQDSAVKEAIHNIAASDWKPYRNDREIAQTVHTMNETKQAFRLVVQRWPKEQPELFDLEPYFYHVIASGGLDEGEEETPEEVVAFYNQRGEIENWIKELKEGFGMNWMPCGETFANAVYFRLGVIAYNLLAAMKVLSLPGRWQRYTIATIRWRLYETAGKVLWDSCRVVLKLATTLEKVRLLLAARRSVQSLVMT